MPGGHVVAVLSGERLFSSTPSSSACRRRSAAKLDTPPLLLKQMGRSKASQFWRQWIATQSLLINPIGRFARICYNAWEDLLTLQTLTTEPSAWLKIPQ